MNSDVKRLGRGHGLRARLVLSTALAGLAAGYGGRSAYAGDCLPTGVPGTYDCSGAAAAGDATQVLTGGPLTVTTTPGFGIDTSTTGGDAFTLNANGGLTFSHDASEVDNALYGITGASNGIRADNNGTGALTITTTADVTGTGSGIDASNGYPFQLQTPTDLTIAVGGVTGGILADNYGSGVLSITASGDVEGGIDAKNAGTDLTIEAGAVSRGSIGINARNSGTGALSITTTGDVEGTAGIIADNNGSGALSITTAGDVTGGGGFIGYEGIVARNNNFDSTDLTIDVGAVSAARDGIEAHNEGTGALSITASGDVTRFGGDGIKALNNNSDGTDLTIDVAGSVSSSAPPSGFVSSGINAVNNGAGALSITTAGDVAGTGLSSSIDSSESGIYARNANSDGTDLTIDVGAVTGAFNGITARNFGAGALSITASGDVAGGNAYSTGISAFNSSIFFPNNDATDLTIDVTGNVSGPGGGIYARNAGAGALSITIAGDATGSENLSSSGIRAVNFGAGDLTIDVAGNISGQYDGITARSASGQSITLSGAVTGGSGAGIDTAGARTEITLNEGASVSATLGKASASGNAIVNDVRDSTVTVNSGASVAGTVRLGDGTDKLVFDGGDFSQVTVFDGGTNTGAGQSDTLTFRNATGTLDGSKAVNWEIVSIGGDGVVSLSNTLTADQVTVEAGGLLGGTGTVDGNLTVEDGGAVGPGNSPGDLTIDGDFTLAAGAELFLEVEGTSLGEFDRLLISGDLTFEGDVFFKAAAGITDDLFESTFDIFDFIVEIDLTPGPGLAFDFTVFENANYFFQSEGTTFELALLSDGGFDVGNAINNGGNAVPEPGMLALFGSGLLGLFGLGRVRRRKQALAA